MSGHVATVGQVKRLLSAASEPMASLWLPSDGISAGCAASDTSVTPVCRRPLAISAGSTLTLVKTCYLFYGAAAAGDLDAVAQQLHEVGGV